MELAALLNVLYLIRETCRVPKNKDLRLAISRFLALFNRLHVVPFRWPSAHYQLAFLTPLAFETKIGATLAFPQYET